MKSDFFVFIRRTTFHPNLPSLSTFFTSTSSVCHKPIVMIGAGTGVAPFVGFCREIGDFLSKGGEVHKSIKNQNRDGETDEKFENIVSSNTSGEGDLVAAINHHHHCLESNSSSTSATTTQQNAKSASPPPNLNVGLIYGFTTKTIGSPHLDFFSSLNFLTFFDEAESRPHLRVRRNTTNDDDDADQHQHQPPQPPKRVQQRISERAKLLAKWIIDDGAFVYICGRSAMAREVEDVIEREVLVKAGGMSNDAASRYMQHHMRNNQRLRLDCWES